MMVARPRATSVCAALLVLGVLSGTTTACTGNCQPISTFLGWSHSGGNPYCIAHPSLDCSAKQNYDCDTCDLWRTIDKSGKACTYHYSDVHGDNHPEWIIEPCFAVSGIESILSKTNKADTRTNFLWQQEWTDAVNGNNNKNIKIPAGELGLVMNSFYYRSRHQMHIHAAHLDSKFAADCLKTLPTSVQNKWERPKSQCHSLGFDTISKGTYSLGDVNSMIIDGAGELKTDKLETGALVSAGPASGSYLVTVFKGNKGDHDILYYTS